MRKLHFIIRKKKGKAYGDGGGFDMVGVMSLDSSTIPFISRNCSV